MNEYLEDTCDRQPDLVSYLYGELDESKSATFQQHLRACVGCSAELTQFVTIRSAIATWKQESVVGSLPAASMVSLPTQRKSKSAIVAFREFFNLAPLWTKAGVAAAVLVFFALIALAAANFSSALHRQEANVREPEIKRVPERNEPLQGATANNDINHASDQVAQKEVAPAPDVNHGRSTKAQSRVKDEVGSRRPLTRAERQQLAADLRLTSINDDNNVDLIGERINNY